MDIKLLDDSAAEQMARRQVIVSSLGATDFVADMAGFLPAAGVGG